MTKGKRERNNSSLNKVYVCMYVGSGLRKEGRVSER